MKSIIGYWGVGAYVFDVERESGFNFFKNPACLYCTFNIAN